MQRLSGGVPGKAAVCAKPWWGGGAEGTSVEHRDVKSKGQEWV